MNFNRYITEAEFSELAAFIRREGVVLRFARGERLSGQGLRSHRCGLVVQGAFRYVHADAAGEERSMSWVTPLPESSSATISRCASMRRRR